MLLVSVVVIAVVTASYSYVPQFRVAVFNLAERVQMVLDTGTVGGIGYSRDGSIAGDYGEDNRNEGGGDTGGDAGGLEDGEL